MLYTQDSGSIIDILMQDQVFEDSLLKSRREKRDYEVYCIFRDSFNIYCLHSSPFTSL